MISSAIWYVSTYALLKHDANLRFQIAYARCHIDWAKKNVDTWKEAKDEVEKIEVR